MPGPVSDSYDPEWGTAANAQDITDSLSDVYDRLTAILGGRPPIFILKIVQGDDLPEPITATLTEKQWRLLRFAVERAMDCV